MLGFRAKSKKEIKDAIKAGAPFTDSRFIETSFLRNEYKGDGRYTVVGPDPYNDRRWYATLTVKDGLVIKCE